MKIWYHSKKTEFNRKIEFLGKSGVTKSYYKHGIILCLLMFRETQHEFCDQLKDWCSIDQITYFIVCYSVDPTL